MPPLHLAARSPIPSRFSQRRLVNRTTGERRWLPTTDRSCMSARSLGVRADPAVSSRVRHPDAVPLGGALLSVVLLGGVGSVAQEEANRTVQSNAQAGVRSNRDAAVRALVRQADEFKLTVATWAANGPVIESLTTPTAAVLGVVQDQLSTLARSKGSPSAFVADLQGRIVAFYPSQPEIIGENFSFRDWFIGALQIGHERRRGTLATRQCRQLVLHHTQHCGSRRGQAFDHRPGRHGQLELVGLTHQGPHRGITIGTHPCLRVALDGAIRFLLCDRADPSQQHDRQKRRAQRNRARVPDPGGHRRIRANAERSCGHTRPLRGWQPPTFTCGAVDQPPLRKPRGDWGTCREMEGWHSPMSRHQTPFGLTASQLYDGGGRGRIRKKTHGSRTLVRRLRTPSEPTSGRPGRQQKTQMVTGPLDVSNVTDNRPGVPCGATKVKSMTVEVWSAGRPSHSQTRSGSPAICRPLMVTSVVAPTEGCTLSSSHLM